MSYRYCLIALLLPLQVFAQSVGKITFTEGKVRVLRDTSVLTGTQGGGVEVADIVETAKPGFALIEFPDGTVIALGDATRVMLSRYPQSGKTGPELQLLDGWLKLQSRAADGAVGSAAYGVSSPQQSASVKNASVIMHSAEAGGEVFVESGPVTVGTTDRQGRPTGMQPVKSGQFVTRAANKPPVSQVRASETFVDAMPSAFRDALPARLDRFKDKTVDLKATGAVSYGDVSDWLSAPQSWRSGFVKRFEPRLSDPAFRQQVDAHMKSHPEWDRILHPPRQ